MSSMLCAGIGLAACTGSGGAVYGGSVSAGVSYGAEPPLVEIEPDVWVVEGYDEPVFYAESSYWLYRSGQWYRSPYYDRGWVVVYDVPYRVRSIDRPTAYVRYRGHDGVRYRQGPRGRVIVRDHRSGYNDRSYDRRTPSERYLDQQRAEQRRYQEDLRADRRNQAEMERRLRQSREQEQRRQELARQQERERIQQDRRQDRAQERQMREEQERLRQQEQLARQRDRMQRQQQQRAQRQDRAQERQERQDQRQRQQKQKQKNKKPPPPKDS